MKIPSLLVLGLFVWIAGCAAPAATPAPAPVPPTAPPTVDVAAIRTQVAQTVIADLATSVPVPSPTLVCDPLLFLQTSLSAIDEFNDASTRAGSTARISLSPVIGEMQSIRRAFEARAAPACAQTYQILVTAAMDAEIKGYLTFMREDPDGIVEMRFNEAAKAWEAVLAERVEVEYVLGTPRPPTRTPKP